MQHSPSLSLRLGHYINVISITNFATFSGSVNSGSEVDLVKVLAKKYNFEVMKYKKEPAWGKPISMKLNTWKGTVGSVKNKGPFIYDVHTMSRHLGISCLRCAVKCPLYLEIPCNMGHI